MEDLQRDVKAFIDKVCCPVAPARQKEWSNMQSAFYLLLAPPPLPLTLSNLRPRLPSLAADPSL